MNKSFDSFRVQVFIVVIVKCENFNKLAHYIL